MNVRTALYFTTAIGAALLTAGCGGGDDPVWTAQHDTAICTDRSGTRVPDGNCGHAGTGNGNAFLWYYLGRGSAVPYYGDPAHGGSYARASGGAYFHAPAGSAMTRSTAISRGGFGSSAGGFSGGE